MTSGGERSRRFPRLRARCRVRIRDPFGTWSAATEDLGPRGCRILGERAHTVGALVRLTIVSDRLAEPLDVAGQVVWTRSEAPARAGIWFTGGPPAPGAPVPAAWFAALAVAERGFEPRAAAEIRVEPADGEAGRDPLAQRLLERARQLIHEGCAAAADVILSRAATLAPGDEEIAALLRSGDRGEHSEDHLG